MNKIFNNFLQLEKTSVSLIEILFNLPCPVFWKDLEGNFLGCNKLFLQIGKFHGYGELIGKNDRELPWKEYTDEYYKDDQYVIQTGKTITRVVEKGSINDRMIVSETTKTPLMKDNKIIGVLGVCLDVRERQEADRLKQEKLEEQEKFTKTVLQVVHDIRSPLMVIDILAGEASHFPEEERIMLRNSVQRINDIASNLMNNYKSRGAEKGAQQLPLFVFLSRLFSEKQLQYTKQNIELKLEIEDAAYFAFTLFELGALQRILSNLINNAVESMDRKGSIVLELRLAKNSRHPCEGRDPSLIIEELDPCLRRDDVIMLSIRDNGKGIPPEVLSKIGTQGMSYAKAGTGLGLSHAIETIRKHKGDLKIESTLGQGTTVTLELPLSEAPNWFAQSLTVSENTILIIIDDDPSIHYLWDKKFVDLKLQNTVHHFYFAKELDEWRIKNSNLLKQVILLCDNELIGSDCNGRELIEKYQSQVQDTLLVTSYYAFHELVPDLTRLKTRLLPKELVMQLMIIF
jgi:PAS domain S-box-containing protein